MMSARVLNVRWHRLLVVGAAGLVAGVGLSTVAHGSSTPTTDTTAVSFVPITPKKVWSANSILAGATESVAVIGGTTTVPSNATTVQLTVTVKGAASGAATFFPAGNPAGGAGHTVAWSAGGTTTVNTSENIGLSNKISVSINSSASASVTLSIIGYSTQVTAGDINGSGGTAGQVLTNNGTGGATWKSVGGTAYGAPGANTFVNLQVNVPKIVSSITVPAGSYLVSFTGIAETISSDSDVRCNILAPNGTSFGSTNAHASLSDEALAGQGLMVTTGGNLREQCTALTNPSSVYYPALIALQVGGVSGSFTS